MAKIGRPRKEIPAEAIEQVMRGSSNRSVAAQYGIALTTLSKRVREAGIVRRQGNQPLVLTDDKVLRLYLDGKDLERIAEMVGASVSSVRGCLRGQGVQRVYRDPLRREPPRV